MIRYPRHLTLELTAKCNFCCPYCYCVWHEVPALGGPELDTGGWLRVLDKCAADGVKELLFTGGEVLLRKDLFEILDTARAILPDAKFSLFTNASRLTAPLIDSFKQRQVSLATSLQGLRTYGAMTGTRRKFNRLLSILATASEREWPMAVSMTITKANRDEAADMFVAAALSGASRIQIGAMMAEGRGREHLDLMLTRAEWELVKASIRELPDARVPYSFCEEFICACRTQPEAFLRKWSDSNHKPCPAGRAFGVVGPNGKFRACLHTVEEIVN
ncbi:MAG: radical SAM protein [Kiritimatiellia bacterium]